jgi:very-short-patch-repair endonuclease
MTDLAQRFQQWADELVDLSGRNDLISFRVTKTSTIIPVEDAVRKLLSGESLQMGQVVDLELAESKKAATGLIRDAIEFDEQQGIEVLKLVSGFANWKSDKVSNANAPLFLYSLLVENPGTPIGKIKIKLVDDEPELNPVFLLHLKRRVGVEIDQDALEERISEGEDAVWEELLQQCPPVLELTRRPGFAIKNLRYQKLPMVNDLLSSGDALAQNGLIAALAGDEDSRRSLRDDVSDARREEPDHISPDQEFLVLDSDSSQQWAVNSAMKGQNLVIEGPPGTGKSQTIANLIASYMATGKTVLFVAEKRAAIDAVKKRIDAVGLGDCFLDLHSAETVRKRPAEPFIKALDDIASIPPVDYSENSLDLSNSREKLVARTKAINERRAPWDCTYLDVLQVAIESSLTATSKFSISSGEVNAIKYAALIDLRRAIDELISLSARDLLSRKSPLASALRQSRLVNSSDIQAIVSLIDDLRISLGRISNWIAEIYTLAQRSGSVLMLTSLADVLTVFDSLDQINRDEVKVDTRHKSALGDGELLHLQQSLSKGKLFRLIQYLVDKQYRNSLRTLKSVLSDGVAASAASLRSACRSLRSLMSLDLFGFPSEVRNYPAGLRSDISTVESSLAVLNRFLDRLESVNSSVEVLSDLVAQLETLRLSLPNAPQISTLLQKLRQLGLDENGLLALVIEDICVGSDANQVSASISSAWSERVEELIRIAEPALASSTREFLDATVATYRQSDKTHIQTSGARIRRICAERAHSARRAFPDQVDLLQQQNNRRRKRKSARRLFAEVPEILKTLKPCWAMSPLVVSELLPAQPFFDVVIFDEASQIVPYEAITSILRGNQVIVAGDSKQLSPTRTSFFSSGSEEESLGTASGDDEDSFDAVDETESLLDAVKAVLPPVLGVRTLQWHYRSEDERLIAFSNKHPDLYGGRLITAPSTTDAPPFAYHLVEGSLDQVTGKSPKAEITKTVDLIIQHLSTRPDQSLAVIALGQEHARNIQSEFSRRVGDDPNLPLFPEGRPEERFVIRHLESIQGDERDVVFISTGYGPRDMTRPRYDFGPINRDKNFFGLRRLNVAITRARKRVEVISTINPYQYDDNRLNSIGAKAFIQYLRFVKSGGSDLGDLSSDRVPMNPFEQDIYDALSAAGLGLVSQYGVSGYRLDFAVQHPDEPGRYVLAIEADGASYHSTETARDRDRIRQSHLERLGWRFHRIWSTEWFRNKETEIQLALNAVRESLTFRPVQTADAAQVHSSSSLPDSAQRHGLEPNMPSYPSIDDYRGEISDYILWYCSDGILRSDEDIFNAVFERLPFGRRGRKIVERINGEILVLRSDGRIP